MFTRRRFLQGLGALAVGTRLRAQSYPFSLGVASGYPSPSSITLWTRLTGIDPNPVPVKWEVAADEAFKRVLRSGGALAQRFIGEDFPAQRDAERRDIAAQARPQHYARGGRIARRHAEHEGVMREPRERRRSTHGAKGFQEAATIEHPNRIAAL